MASYKEVMKSGGIIAVVQFFQLIFAFLRNKVIALVLGASGFGYWSLYQTFIEMVSSFSTLGVEQSGVREIAKHNRESKELSYVVSVMMNLLFIISVFASIFAIIFSKVISNNLFNSDEYYGGIIVVSIAVLFTNLSKGQRSAMNGVRDLRGLAISQIVGAVSGSILSMILVFVFGLKGIPYYLLIISLTAYFSTKYFYSKLKIERVNFDLKIFFERSKEMIYVGLGFSASAVIAAIMTYLSRIYLSQYFDVSTVGIYQGCWTISNLYIGIILSAMGVDLMPRLMKVINDNKQINLLINEQMEIGVLIATIGVVVIIFLSSFLLEFLYSSEFIKGTEIIRWQVLGVGMRVLGFPFGYAIMAKKKSLIYFIVQTIFWTLDYILLIVFSKLFSFDGLGINYFLSYSVYFTIMLFVGRKLYDFTFSKLLLKIVACSVFLIAISWFFTLYVQSTSSLYWIVFITITGLAILYVNFVLSRHMNLSILFFLKTKLKTKK